MALTATIGGCMGGERDTAEPIRDRIDEGAEDDEGWGTGDRDQGEFCMAFTDEKIMLNGKVWQGSDGVESLQYTVYASCSGGDGNDVVTLEDEDGNVFADVNPIGGSVWKFMDEEPFHYLTLSQDERGETRLSIVEEVRGDPRIQQDFVFVVIEDDEDEDDDE